MAAIVTVFNPLLGTTAGNLTAWPQNPQSPHIPSRVSCEGHGSHGRGMKQTKAPEKLQKLQGHIFDGASFPTTKLAMGLVFPQKPALNSEP